MNSDFLIVAQSRQEQLTQALVESIGPDVAVSIDAAAESFSPTDTIAYCFAAKASGPHFNCILLVESETLERIGGANETGGPAATLQALATKVASALAAEGHDAGIRIDISSPGELGESTLAGCEFIVLNATLGDADHVITVAFQPDSETGQKTTGISLPEFDASGSPSKQLGNGLGLLADVQVDVTVELGRRRLPINELLTLTRGSIIELDKLVGEPLEVYVNNRLIADGEAVVIDEQFGIRITNIIPSAQRALSG